MVARPALINGGADRELELLEREVIGERGQDLTDERAVNAQLDQLAEEQGLVVQGVGHVLGCRHEASRLVHADATIRIDRAAAEGNRRNVSFAGGAGESRNRRDPGVQARLVRVPHHRGVERAADSRAYSWVKVRADQQTAVLAQMLIRQEVLFDLLKAMQKEVTSLLMPVVKFAHHVAEQGVDLGLGERQDPRRIRSIRWNSLARTGG